MLPFFRTELDSLPTLFFAESLFMMLKICFHYTKISLVRDGFRSAVFTNKP